MSRSENVNDPAVDGAHWVLPSGAALIKHPLCMLARPTLLRYQHANDFRFFEATLVLSLSGQLTLESDNRIWELADTQTLMVVAKNTTVNIQKTPGQDSSAFRSVFLALAPDVITEFYQRYGQGIRPSSAVAPCTITTLDEDLSDTLHYCIRGIDAAIEFEQLANRLMGLLLALNERGIIFPRPSAAGLGERLKHLLGMAPEKYWTAAKAGRELAVSEATLRRRLAEEGVNFSHLLTEIRMHHAMMLLQTTNFSVSQIADACGYRALSRFSMRFKSRFGFSPSNIR
ncbi:helix-turn-helix transcriptional regulator [Pseudomonas gingeri]|uniref:Helix-turn-helix transcriptional regulator n=1 Tax=Pseudomonas gingeri TaxID=117681 RepID=A0A7Y7XIS4_9PSED|nr:helix-turn-helix transcriptional regulator [Pseudomonas gingeri]NWB99628.1 helix-turn-helix transcriptional regulator [Pseudomonas gingeri]